MSSSTITNEPDTTKEVINAQDKTEEDYEVRFRPDDLDNPHSWSCTSRWYITFLGGMLGVNA